MAACVAAADRTGAGAEVRIKSPQSLTAIFLSYCLLFISFSSEFIFTTPFMLNLFSFNSFSFFEFLCLGFSCLPSSIYYLFFLEIKFINVSFLVHNFCLETKKEWKK